MTEICVLALMVAVVLVVNHLFEQHLRATHRRMHEEHERAFPGKCSICAYQRYLRLHGHVDYAEPPPKHLCIERPKGRYRA